MAQRLEAGATREQSCRGVEGWRSGGVSSVDFK
jgi:hypothetical protein